MGIWTATPRTWVAGEVPTAANFNTDVRDFGRAFADAWTSYTPTVTASGTATSGWTQTGYYMRAGKLIHARFHVIAPSSNFGTGTYRIALPVTAASTYPSGGSLIGTVYFEDSGTASYAGFARILASATYLQVAYSTSGSTISNYVGPVTQPFTFAVDDFMAGTITYEAA